jgi:predicted ATPase with chaperone activity
MSDELNKLVAEARTRPITDEEREVQRVSFAYGNLALDKPETSRELVQQMSDIESLTMQRDGWMKNYYLVSRDYDRVLRTAGALAGCVFGLLVLIAFLIIR